MILTSERLQYQKFKEANFSDYFSLVSQAPVMQHITGKALTLEQAKERYKKVIEFNKQFQKIGVFSARSLENNEFVGLSKITFVKEGEAELGYSMLPKFWGQGYGTEMSLCMMELAIATPFIKNLMALVDPVNGPSIKILQKLQFTLSEKTTLGGLPAHIYRLELK